MSVCVPSFETLLELDGDLTGCYNGYRAELHNFEDFKPIIEARGEMVLCGGTNCSALFLRENEEMNGTQKSFGLDKCPREGREGVKPSRGLRMIKKLAQKQSLGTIYLPFQAP